MNVDFPFQIDRRGRTAGTGDEDHIRDLIEQVLFTSPGERVNRPDFGSSVLQMVFAPDSGELASAAQFLVQGALQHWLGDLIVVESVLVENDDAALRISVNYEVRRDRQKRSAQFARGF